MGTSANVTPLPALSASRLEAWDRCPRAYRFEYVDRLPVPLADQRPRLLGEVAHLLLEHYTRACLAARQPALPGRLPALARELARAERQPARGPGLYREAEALVARFLDAHPVPVAEVAAVELPLALSADGRLVEWRSPEAWLRGIPDLLLLRGRQATVRDLKSGWVADEIELAHGWAPGLYPALVWAWAPGLEDPMTVEYQSLRSGYTTRIEVSRAHAAQTVEWAQDVAGTLAHHLAAPEDPASFPPRPSSACETCPFVSRCPAGQAALDAVGEGPTPTEAEARHLAGLLLAGEAKLARLRTRVQRYLADREPLTLNGLQVGYFPTMGEYDAKAVLAALDALGEASTDVAMINRKTLARLFRRHPGLEAQLASARTPSPPWFGHKKSPRSEAAHG